MFLRSCLTLFCLIGLAFGHGMLTNPAPRTGKNDNVRSTPCGTNTPAPIDGRKGIVGQPYSVQWKIVADHGGFVSLHVWKGQQETILKSGIPLTAEAATVNFSEPCEGCVFQWVWKTSNEATPYFGCADIDILAAPKALTLSLFVEEGTTVGEVMTVVKTAIASIAGISESLVLIKDDEVNIDGTEATVIVSFNYDDQYNSNDSKLTLVTEAVKTNSDELKDSGLNVASAQIEGEDAIQGKGKKPKGPGTASPYSSGQIAAVVVAVLLGIAISAAIAFLIVTGKFGKTTPTPSTWSA